MGRSAFRDPGIGLRSWTISDFGLAVCNCVWPSHHRRPNIGLLSRNASCHGLCSSSPSSPSPSSVLGNGGPHVWLHSQRPYLQRLHPSRGSPLVICDSRGL